MGKGLGDYEAIVYNRFMHTPLYNSWFIAEDNPDHDFANDDELDLAFAESLAERFLHQYTEPGDTVFDPFAGFGTTLVVAQRLGCIGLGVEIDPERQAIIARRLRRPSRILLGDARAMDQLELPALDFILTSPPYWDAVDEALDNYQSPAASYQVYLAELQRILASLKPNLRPSAALVVVVQNMQRDDGSLLPFAWDVGRSLAEVFWFEREVIACKFEDEPNPLGNHQYCLVFRNQ